MENPPDTSGVVMPANNLGRRGGLVTYREAARLVHVPVSTVKGWRHRGILTPWGVNGRRVLFHTDDVYAAEKAVRTSRPKLLDKRAQTCQPQG